MHASSISVVLLSVAISLSACSSNGADKNKPGRDGGNRSGTGGSIASGGTRSDGGATGAGGKTGSGGMNPALCQVDSGADKCRLCLASQCCSDVVACFSNSGCRAAFDEYQRCVRAAKNDANTIANCYSVFTIGLKEAGTKHLGLTTCDYLDCNSECGAPSQM
jgi:hypothetical protein